MKKIRRPIGFVLTLFIGFIVIFILFKPSTPLGRLLAVLTFLGFYFGYEKIFKIKISRILKNPN